MGPGENAKICETVQCACAKVLMNVGFFGCFLLLIILIFILYMMSFIKKCMTNISFVPQLEVSQGQTSCPNGIISLSKSFGFK